MKMILKSALAAAAIVGATSMVPGLAFAGVGLSIGIGLPGPVFGPAYAPCGPDYGPCADGYNPYEGDYYYDPIFFDGSWYHGPYRWRMENGQRMFYVNGGWHRNEWTGGAYPASITFHNGGYYRGGRYDGFGDSARINARFHPSNAATQGARPYARPEGGQMNQDHQEGRDDRNNEPHDRADGPHN